jgi:hypothetical membrane protein
VAVKRTNLLLLCGVLGPIFFITVFLLDGATRPHYEPLRHWVSHLSLGRRGWLGTTNLVVSGLFFLAFARGVYNAIKHRWGSVFIALFGIGLLAAALFPIDPGLDYPADLESLPTFSGRVHDAAGLLIFASLSAACFVMRRWLKNQPHGQGWVRYSLLTGISVMVFFIACSVLVTLDYADVFPNAPSGLLERLSLTTGCVWLLLFARRLLLERSSFSSSQRFELP